jgi:hypothetical protein
MNGRNHLSATNDFCINILVPPRAEPVCLSVLSFVEHWLARSLPVEKNIYTERSPCFFCYRENKRSSLAVLHEHRLYKLGHTP